MMSKTREDLELVVEAMVERGRSQVGPEPEVEELLAYHRGELSEEEADRFRERLAHYPNAAQLLAAFTAEEEPRPGDPDHLSEKDGAALWAGLQEWLAGQAAGAEATETIPEERVGGFRSRVAAAIAPPRPRLTLWAGWAAAFLLVVVLGPVLYVQHQRIDALGRQVTEPRVNFVHKRLAPADRRRGSSTEEAVRLPPGEEPYLLTLGLYERPRFADYRLEIVDTDSPGAPTVWTESGVEIAPGDSVPLYLPGDFLAPGRYEIRLYGVDGGGGELVATFPLIV
jgi:hypothetical protein